MSFTFRSSRETLLTLQYVSWISTVDRSIFAERKYPCGFIFGANVGEVRYARRERIIFHEKRGKNAIHRIVRVLEGRRRRSRWKNNVEKKIERDERCLFTVLGFRSAKMSHDILSIGGEPLFDDRIVKIETHTYNAYANTTFGNSDEIRIPIQNQDLYTLPCESFLFVEGRFVARNNAEQPVASLAEQAKLTNNCVAFMFDEIRYELDGVEIDRNRNVGITTTLKNYLAITADEEPSLLRAGWYSDKRAPATFDFCVPLRLLLGFCEDYKRIVINARHELILIRARNDNNSVQMNPNFTYELTLTKLQWRMPHVVLNDVNKLSLLRTLENGQYLNMGFRSWDLYEYPLLQSTTKHTWAVKASAQLEKPRYVIFALQTARRNSLEQDASRFDSCKLINCKLFLNSEYYPYDDLNVDFESGRISVLYNMFINFRKTYYPSDNRTCAMAPLFFFVNAPLVVVDCSRQNESVKGASVDIRIEFECKENVPPSTTAYCLIIHDRLVQYNPLTNVVRKII